MLNLTHIQTTYPRAWAECLRFFGVEEKRSYGKVVLFTAEAAPTGRSKRSEGNYSLPDRLTMKTPEEIAREWVYIAEDEHPARADRLERDRQALAAEIRQAIEAAREEGRRQGRNVAALPPDVEMAGKRLSRLTRSDLHLLRAFEQNYFSPKKTADALGLKSPLALAMRLRWALSRLSTEFPGKFPRKPPKNTYLQHYLFSHRELIHSSISELLDSESYPHNPEAFTP